MQACAYCSSVDSAGTSTRVVTPSGDTPIGSEGVPASTDCPGLIGGAGACEVACPPPPEEHAIRVAVAIATTKAEADRERHRYRRMDSIYATLAAVMERTGSRECCRP